VNQGLSRARRAGETRILNGVNTKEIEMTGTSGARDKGDGGRRLNTFWMVVLWLVLIVLALAPYPWV
jgi:hypothetical protein